MRLDLGYSLFAFVNRFVPLAQQGTDELNLYERISFSFREGPNAFPIYVGILILGVSLIAFYGVLKLVEYYSSAEEETKRTYSILESIQSNLKLSDKQDRYLGALIEKFKDRSHYEPEVSTDYLQEYLFFILQNLTYAPKRQIRRKTHYVPDFRVGDELSLMFEVSEDSYTTLEAEILDQTEERVTIRKPHDELADGLSENRTVESTYQKGDLTLRGEAKVTRVTEDELVIDFRDGMHFEEKRTYDRISLDGLDSQLIVQEWEGKTYRFDAELTDISIGGARLNLPGKDDRLHRNMRGRVQFELPDEGEFDLEIIVIHLEEVDGATRVGVEFVDPGMANRNFLHEFVDEHKTE